MFPSTDFKINAKHMKIECLTCWRHCSDWYTGFFGHFSMGGWGGGGGSGDFGLDGRGGVTIISREIQGNALKFDGSMDRWSVGGLVLMGGFGLDGGIISRGKFT